MGATMIGGLWSTSDVPAFPTAGSGLLLGFFLNGLFVFAGDGFLEIANTLAQSGTQLR